MRDNMVTSVWLDFMITALSAFCEIERAAMGSAHWNRFGAPGSA